MIVFCKMVNSYYRRFVRDIQKDKKEANPVNYHSKEHNGLSAKLVTPLAKYTKQEASYKQNLSKQLQLNNLLVNHEDIQACQWIKK